MAYEKDNQIERLAQLQRLLFNLKDGAYGMNSSLPLALFYQIQIMAETMLISVETQASQADSLASIAESLKAIAGEQRRAGG